MKAKRFLIALAALLALASASFASTTSYTFEAPAGSTAINYTKGAYTELGTVKVTASDFDTKYGVSVYLQTDNTFTNTANSKHTVAYDVVVGSASSHTVLANNGEIAFTASEINNGQASKTIGIVITGEPDNAIDGTYSTNLSFNAYLSGSNTAPATKGQLFSFGRYSDNKPILWKVLTVDTANNRALLLVDEPTADMKQPYHKDGSANSLDDQKWSNSTIKTWLIGTFTKYFTDDEMNRVLSVKIDDSDLAKQDTSCDQIIDANGTDEFFLLSLKDTENTEYFSGDEDREASVYGSGYPAHWWTNGVFDNVEVKKKDTKESVGSKIFNFGNFFGMAGQVADAAIDNEANYEIIHTYYIAAVAQTGSTGIHTEEDGSQTFSGFNTDWSTSVYIRPAMWLNTAGSVKADINTKSAALSFTKKSDYTLIPPEGSMAMNYTKGVYNSIGSLSVAAGANFSDTQEVNVEVQHSGKLTNTQNSGQNVTYELIRGSEADYTAGKHTVLKNGDTITFTADNIKAKTTIPMGVVISSDPYAVSDGDYKNDITFKASLGAIPTVGDTYTFGKYKGNPIKWNIIAVDKTNRGMLLLSYYALETAIMYNNQENNKWTASAIKKYLNDNAILNGVEYQFINSGFTAEEQSRILKIKLEDDDLNNSKLSVIDPNGTCSFFLLTLKDLETYLPVDSSASTEEQFRQRMKRFACDADGNVYEWWLRTSYSDNEQGYGPTVSVVFGGNYAGLPTWNYVIAKNNGKQYSTQLALMPAVWVKY